MEVREGSEGQSHKRSKWKEVVECEGGQGPLAKEGRLYLDILVQGSHC